MQKRSASPPRRGRKDSADASAVFYSKVWFNTPEDLWSALCSGCYQSKYVDRGIKPDGIINFLSNEPPFKPTQRLRYRSGPTVRALLRRGSFDTKHSADRHNVPKILLSFRRPVNGSTRRPGEPHVQNQRRRRFRNGRGCSAPEYR